MSYGKGLVQNTFDVGYNAKVKLTTAKYYIPSGRCIQSVEYKNGECISRMTSVLSLKHVPAEQCSMEVACSQMYRWLQNNNRLSLRNYWSRISSSILSHSSIWARIVLQR
ncbi:MAG: hypothetical protein IPP25_11360 [Saprospiraceae bacterium]|nr:hypothetical protein [Candidatus Opimibacter skivensis]